MVKFEFSQLELYFNFVPALNHKNIYTVQNFLSIYLIQNVPCVYFFSECFENFFSYLHYIHHKNIHVFF